MAAMARPNRNCCWVGQPDPTAWKKPTGDGCLGYARKPQYRLMRPSESAMLELIEKIKASTAKHELLLPRPLLPRPA